MHSTVLNVGLYLTLDCTSHETVLNTALDGTLNNGRYSIPLQEARGKFVLTEAELLVTSGPLDREEREVYMVTIVLGRKGLIRGRKPVQIKVGAAYDSRQ